MVFALATPSSKIVTRRASTEKGACYLGQVPNRVSAREKHTGWIIRQSDTGVIGVGVGQFSVKGFDLKKTKRMLDIPYYVC